MQPLLRGPGSPQHRDAFTAETIRAAAAVVVAMIVPLTENTLSHWKESHKLFDESVAMLREQIARVRGKPLS